MKKLRSYLSKLIEFVRGEKSSSAHRPKKLNVESLESRVLLCVGFDHGSHDEIGVPHPTTTQRDGNLILEGDIVSKGLQGADANRQLDELQAFLPDPDLSRTTGRKSQLFIRVRFIDRDLDPNKDFTDGKIREVMGTVDNYFRRNSYGKTSYPLNQLAIVPGVLTIPKTVAQMNSETQTPNFAGTIHSEAKRLASARGFNPDQFDVVTVVFPRMSDGGRARWGGLGGGRSVWLHESIGEYLIAHELGHTLGVGHSGYWDPNDRNATVSTPRAGEHHEYGNHLDVMGSGPISHGDFGAYWKGRLGWLDDSQVIDVTADGTFSLFALDEGSSRRGQVYGMRIKRNDGQEYWLEHRSSTDVREVDDGIVFNLRQFGNDAPDRDPALIDLTPNSRSSIWDDRKDAPLVVGQTYQDNVARITVRALSRGQSGGQSFIRVSVDVDDVDPTGPTAVLSASNVVSSGAQQEITVTYRDNVAVDVSDLNNGDLTVEGPGGFRTTPVFVSVNRNTDGTPRTARYRVIAPGGRWDQSDNGTYTVRMNANQVRDTSGNPVSPGALGTFRVNIADNTVPTASLSARDIRSEQSSPQTLTVTYRDDIAVDVSDLDNRDLVVTGPNGFRSTAIFQRVNDNRDGTPRTATYYVNAPGGRWDIGDNGTYTVQMNSRQVSDTNGNFVNAGALGTFRVNIADSSAPMASINAPTITVGGGTSQLIYVTYRDDVAIDVSDLNQLDLLVNGPNGFRANPSFVGVNINQDGTPRVARYRVNAPGGTWDQSDNGNYVVQMNARQVSDTSGNFVSAGELGTMRVNIGDSVSPTASLLATGSPIAGASTHLISVVFRDDVGIDVSDLNNVDLVVRGPNGFATNPEFVSVNVNEDGTPRIASYRIHAPGGQWDSSDNGVYTVAVNPNQVSDTSGNWVARGNIGTFRVNLNSDQTIPTATMNVQNITTSSNANHTLYVTYRDNVGIDVSTLSGADLYIQGPNRFRANAVYAGVNVETDGTPRIARYEIRPPGGQWNSEDNGFYRIWVNPSQVSDTNGNWMSFTYLGSFNVSIQGSTSDQIGVYRPQFGAFFLDKNGNDRWDGRPTDEVHRFGARYEVPVVGDWNGDGVDEIGIFRRSTGEFYVDANGDGRWQSNDQRFSFGIRGDYPVVGDWNGDGVDNLGVFRVATGTFHLDTNRNGRIDSNDQATRFGSRTDQPIVGDWDGDGVDEIGVYRAGVFFQDLNGNGKWDGTGSDRIVRFGARFDQPVIGDFNGDGQDDVGVYRNGRLYRDSNGNNRWDGRTIDSMVAFGGANDIPLAGRWIQPQVSASLESQIAPLLQDEASVSRYNSLIDSIAPILVSAQPKLNQPESLQVFIDLIDRRKSPIDERADEASEFPHEKYQNFVDGIAAAGDSAASEQFELLNLLLNQFDSILLNRFD